MISNESKLVDHCPKTLPSGEPRGFDDETGKTAGCLDVRVDRLREFHKVVVARSQILVARAGWNARYRGRIRSCIAFLVVLLFVLILFLLVRALFVLFLPGQMV